MITPAIGPKNEPIVSIIDKIPDWLNFGSHNAPNTNPRITINNPEIVLSKLFGKKFNNVFWAGI